MEKPELKTTGERLEDAMREVGVLLIAFAPLNVALNHHQGGDRNYLFFFLGLGVSLFIAALKIERFRSDQAFSNASLAFSGFWPIISDDGLPARRRSLIMPVDTYIAFGGVAFLGAVASVAAWWSARSRKSAKPSLAEASTKQEVAREIEEVQKRLHDVSSRIAHL